MTTRSFGLMLAMVLSLVARGPTAHATETAVAVEPPNLSTPWSERNERWKAPWGGSLPSFLVPQDLDVSKQEREALNETASLLTGHLERAIFHFESVGEELRENIEVVDDELETSEAYRIAHVRDALLKTLPRIEAHFGLALLELKTWDTSAIEVDNNFWTRVRPYYRKHYFRPEVEKLRDQFKDDLDKATDRAVRQDLREEFRRKIKQLRDGRSSDGYALDFIPHLESIAGSYADLEPSEVEEKLHADFRARAFQGDGVCQGSADCLELVRAWHETLISIGALMNESLQFGVDAEKLVVFFKTPRALLRYRLGWHLRRWLGENQEKNLFLTALVGGGMSGVALLSWTYNGARYFFTLLNPRVMLLSEAFYLRGFSMNPEESFRKLLEDFQHP